MTFLRRLPIPLPPAGHETIASWLHRLAMVHGLDPEDLRQLLNLNSNDQDAGTGQRLTNALAALTGIPAARLPMALPELQPHAEWIRLRHLTQRDCPHCTTRHEGGPVRRLFAHHVYLCTRHGYWIGPPDATRDDPPPRLGHLLPELPAAQRQLRHAVTRWGWAAVFDATAGATTICMSLLSRGQQYPLWTRWQQRLDRLMPTGYQRSMFMAAIFPEVTALARVLVTARWQPSAGDGLGIQPLISAAGRALDDRTVTTDPGLPMVLTAWLAARPFGPLLWPVDGFTQSGHHDDGRPRCNAAQHQAEQRIADRYRRDPRAPHAAVSSEPLPYAHQIAPVPPLANASDSNHASPPVPR